MDKSPLKTLTLEDFLESERHKLAGNLTPVTPETFAKWKKERLDKRAAEEQARQAKEATGRAMFEQGGWEESDEEEGDRGEDDEDDDDDNDGDESASGRDEWDMETLRKETERIREEDEQKRLQDVGGQVAIEKGGREEDEEDEDEAVGVDEVEINGGSEA